jgi:hypothetical protein
VNDSRAEGAEKEVEKDEDDATNESIEAARVAVAVAVVASARSDGSKRRSADAVEATKRPSRGALLGAEVVGKLRTKGHVVVVGVATNPWTVTTDARSAGDIQSSGSSIAVLLLHPLTVVGLALEAAVPAAAAVAALADGNMITVNGSPDPRVQPTH